MATDLSAVQTKIRSNFPFLRKKYHVEKIGVFGSVARGDNTKKSDIDLLINFSEPISYFTFFDLEEFLTNTLGTKTDLVTIKALKPIIKDDILNEVVYV